MLVLHIFKQLSSRKFAGYRDFTLGLCDFLSLTVDCHTYLPVFVIREINYIERQFYGTNAFCIECQPEFLCRIKAGCCLVGCLKPPFYYNNFLDCVLLRQKLYRFWATGIPFNISTPTFTLVRCGGAWHDSRNGSSNSLF